MVYVYKYTKYQYAKNVKSFIKINTSSHPNILLLGPPALMSRAARNPGGVQPKLESEVEVANALEHGAQTERPGNDLATEEKIADLRRVTEDPCCDDRKAEAFARARAVVGQNLGQGKCCFNG